jgi:predicted lipoprotein with Yx(FWY)xxD motif
MALLKIAVLSAGIAILAAFSLAVADGGAPPPTAVSAVRDAHVKVRGSSLGRHLVDAGGRSLYLFEKDRGGRSSCYGSCASLWPPLLTGPHVVRGAGVSRAKLGTVARRGGGREVTYAGHPLYYYAGDSRPGQIRGEGRRDFGASWDIVSPSGKGIDR